MKKLYYIGIIICLCIILLCLFMILKELYERKTDIENFERVREVAMTPLSEEQLNASVSVEYEGEDSKRPKINLLALQNTNSDCAAWLFVEGTNISYPVMHTPDESEKYIYKNFYGDKSSSGTPFLDGRCTLDSENLIIYGHNMKNGTMFGGLKKYLEKDYFERHNEIELITNSKATVYKVFAVVRVKDTDDWYSYIDECKNEIISCIKEKSTYHTDIEVTEKSKFITLSTCYGKDKSDRLLLIGIAE